MINCQWCKISLVISEPRVSGADPETGLETSVTPYSCTRCGEVYEISSEATSHDGAWVMGYLMHGRKAYEKAKTQDPNSEEMVDKRKQLEKKSNLKKAASLLSMDVSDLKFALNELDLLMTENAGLVFENGNLNQKVLRLENRIKGVEGEYIECGHCGAREHQEDIENGCQYCLLGVGVISQ